MIFCPEINSSDYKALARQVGHVRAHEIWDMNNGQPIHLNRDGSESNIFNKLEEKYGRDKAIEMRAKMFSDNLIRLNNGNMVTNDTIDIDDNITLDNDLLYSLGKHVDTSDVVLEGKLKQEFVETSNIANRMVDAFQDVLPGFNVVRESYHTVKNTPFASMRGWVDGEGLHFNMSSMHFTTPVHELAHIWLHVMEMKHPDIYSRIVQMIEQSKLDNPDLYNSVRSQYKHLTEEQIDLEYAATVAGLVSRESVEKHFLRKNEEKESSFIDRIWQAIKDIAEYIRNSFNNIFNNSLKNIDYATASLDELFLALTDQYILGNNILNMNYDEIQTFMDKYYSDIIEAQIENDTEKGKINNISDITAWIINNHDVSVNVSDQFKNEAYKRKFVDDIRSKIIVNKNKDRYFYAFGQKYEFGRDWDMGLDEQKIIDDIIPAYETMINSFPDIVMNIINEHAERKRPLEEIIQDSFQDMKLNSYMLYKIESALGALGIDEPIYKAMRYNDLIHDPHYAHLYRENLSGYNPVVLFHSSDTEVLDISIVDLATGFMGRQDSHLSYYQNNLASSFGYPNSDFKYSNNKADIRRVLVATQLAAMNKAALDSNQKLRVRRLGVIGFQGRSVTPYMVRDIHEALKESRKLWRLPDLEALMNTSNMGYNWFAELLSDDKAWHDSSILQSWHDRLQSYYQDFYLELGLTSEERDAIVNETDTWTLADLLEKRKKEIENKQPNGFLNNTEHKIITQYLLWKERNMDINNSNVKDIRRTFMKITPVHSMNSDIIQVFSIVAEAAKAEFVNRVNKYKDKLSELIEKSLESRGKSVNLIGNWSENVFEHLFVRGDIVVQNDSKRYKKNDVLKDMVIKNILHGSYDMAAARAAGLTDADIELADYIYESIKEQYIQLKLHNLRFSKKEIDVKFIKKDIEALLLPGHIPTVTATDYEMMRKLNLKEATQKKVNKTIHGEYMAGFVFNDEIGSVHDMFARQISPDVRLNTIGLKMDANTRAYIEVDMRNYDNTTINLEYLFTVFTLNAQRKMVVEDKVIPAYNTARQWMNIVENEYGLFSQENTREFLRQYYKRIVERQNLDEKDDRMAAITRTITSAYSYISLGMRPTVWMRSFYYNVQNNVIQALSNKAWLTRNTPEGKGLNMPSAADMTKAHGLLFSEFKKIYELGKKYSIINSSEIDIVENVTQNITERSPLKKQMAHIGNYYGDIATRLLAMTAFMLHDGSYEAHKFDPNTGELTYDVKLDGRFYNSDGTWKSDKAKAIHHHIVEMQRRSGLLDKDGNQTVGYDFEETNTRMKWYADKYLIGSMDEYQKVLLGNTYTGQLFMQFRHYLPDKVVNWIGGKQENFYGGVRDVVMTDDEQVRVIQQQINTEGMAASVWYLIKDVVDLAANKNLSFEEMSKLLDDPMRAMNMRQITLRAIFFVTVFLALKHALDKGMSDRDRDKLKFLYGNLMLWQEYFDLQASIMPITGLVDNIMSLSIGEGNWKRIMLRYTGPVNDILWYYELFTSTDNVTPTALEKQRMRNAGFDNITDYQAHLKEKRIERKEREKKK